MNDVFSEPESLEDKENEDPLETEAQISRLWVDRFSPRHYTELLSDDVSFLLVFHFNLYDDTFPNSASVSVSVLL